ncbi:MAG: phosphonoacetate hydrolase [Gammaproteobacteria bacterium]|nr:phosphonoacetate hydrolase [Gammaproteobacteria bacterium]
MTTVKVNEREYATPTAPVVVVCIDGCEPDYLDAAMAAGRMPWLQNMLGHGTRLTVDCVVPSFTNPNNLSIVTGAPPSVHGISGNFFLDPETGDAVMMNEPRFLRARTIFQAFAEQGASVAIITAKDKLRRLLGHGLSFGDSPHICFSSEHSDIANLAENGIDRVLGLVGMEKPSVYSAALSEFVFAAGVKLMESRRPDLMYLSTTDYIQHKHAPGADVANDFYEMMDGYLAQLDALGAVIAFTADHGMNAKHDADGAPQVIYLQDVLDRWLGADAARVILPITDPYVVHHGALGSYATAYLPEGADVGNLLSRIRELPGVEYAASRTDAASDFELPPERLGDIVVVSEKHVTLGTSAADHDLSGLDAPLRSHGGISEQKVPLVLNRRLSGVDTTARLRNFDAFHLALNHIQEETRQ